MDLQNDTRFNRNIKCADAYTESAVDYSLPDYLGDVRKILFTEATLRPSGRFAGGESIEFSGVVVYNVIYLDSEGELSSVEFTSDYEYSVKCSGENYRESISDTRISNYALRLVGPRKISARASLVGSVRVSESHNIAITGDVFDNQSAPEVDSRHLSVRCTRLSSVSEREYAETLARLDGAILDEVKVVYAAAEPRVESLEYTPDGVNVKGKLRMMAVIKEEDMSARMVEEVLPFDEVVKFDDSSEDMQFIPELTVTSLKPSLNADEDGVTLVMNCILEFCIGGEKNESVEVAVDCYLKDAPCENQYDDLSYSRLAQAVSLKATHSAELDRAEIDSDSLHEVVFITATPKVESVRCEGGSANILGEIRYSGIASEMQDGRVSYVSFKFSSPFASSLNLGTDTSDNLHVDTKVTAHNASASLDSSKLYASCTLECGAVAYEELSERILSSSRLKEGEKFEQTGAKITVYYPSDDETLFSVAKKFRTSSVKIASDNNITESVFAADNPDGRLQGVKKLIIY